MSSFAFLGTFREGQWRSFRKFMLEERRDAASRVGVILQELDRIGDVSMGYAQVEDPESGVSSVSERRTGIQVTGGSSLEKLLGAYSMVGGNPLDISMFLMPDSGTLEEQGFTPTQPGGGLLYRTPITYAYTSQPTEGASLLAYDKRRAPVNITMQSRLDGDVLQAGRRWLTQEMRHKRWDLESRIIKLCDLREQLLGEIKRIVWACGPSQGLPQPYIEEWYGIANTAPRIAYRFDAIFRTPSEGVAPTTADLNTEALGSHPNLLTDDPDGQEDWTAV